MPPTQKTPKKVAAKSSVGEKKNEPVKKEEAGIPIYNTVGQEVERVALPKKIFEEKGSDKLIAQYIRVYLACQRQGTISTKTRGEVVGSTRKIYRQKGTGRARHGPIKAPIFVGGGVAHGPKPRDFSLTMNKKQKRRVFFAILSQKFSAGDIQVVSGFSEIKPRTKETCKVLDHFASREKKRVLIILPEKGFEHMRQGGRNVSYAEFADAQTVNPYAMLKARKILLAKESLAVLEKRHHEN